MADLIASSASMEQWTIGRMSVKFESRCSNAIVRRWQASVRFDNQALPFAWGILVILQRKISVEALAEIELTFDRRQAELFCNFSVSDPASILQSHTSHQLGQVAAACDGAAAPKRFELDIADSIVLRVHANLKPLNSLVLRALSKTDRDPPLRHHKQERRPNPYQHHCRSSASSQHCEDDYSDLAVMRC